MSAIYGALSKLENAIGGLESSTGALEKHLAGQQRDMFVPVAVPPVAGRFVDPTLIAKRLDRAIDRVQQILEEEVA